MDVTENSRSNPLVGWPSVNCSPTPEQDKSALLAPVLLPENQTFLQPLSVLPQPEMDSSCMEIEAAQRKLQEIEDRYVWMRHAQTADTQTNMNI